LNARTAYTEVLQVVDAEGIAEQVQQRILEHAAVTVAVRGVSVSHSNSSGALRKRLPKALTAIGTAQESGNTYERTNRSRFSQSGFLGLNLMNLLNRTWATGAMPIGAPG
jgi:hypothetical protein